jgi:hypothetical protein
MRSSPSFFFLHHPTYAMSTAYDDVAACASRIMKLVGPRTDKSPKLVLSGGSPDLPLLALQDLLSRPTYAGLDHTRRHQISSVVDKTISSLRDRFLSQFWQVAGELHSQRNAGVLDADVETSLISMYESRYSRCLQDIRTLLSRLLANEMQGVDHRNPRGGVGDVSAHRFSQADNSAKPLNPRSSIQAHHNPPLSRDRPHSKAHILGASSSESRPILSISVTIAQADP